MKDLYTRLFEKYEEQFYEWLMEKQYITQGEWDMYDVNGMMTTLENEWSAWCEDFVKENNINIEEE